MNSWINKKDVYYIKWVNIFPNRMNDWNTKFKLDLSYKATIADLKGATGVDTLNLATKLDLASLKAEKD